MKSLGDFSGFAEHFDTLQILGTKKSKYLRKDNGPVLRLRRDLCRAFAQNKAGFSSDNRQSAKEFATVLNKAGFDAAGVKVKRTDVENGAKSRFEPNTTPPTNHVQAILNDLQIIYPSLDPTKILSVVVFDDALLMPALARPAPQ